MAFQFESFQGFLTMAGHGSFVWACYLVTFVTIIVLMVIPRQQKKTLQQHMQRQRRIKQLDSNHS